MITQRTFIDLFAVYEFKIYTRRTEGKRILYNLTKLLSEIIGLDWVRPRLKRIIITITICQENPYVLLIK